MMPFWEPHSEHRASGVALVLLTLFFAIGFPYSSGLEIPRPGVQLFYSCAGPIYLDLTLLRWRAPRAGVAAWLLGLAVQLLALGVVRVKVGHWVVPSRLFLLGAALFGLGVGVGFSYLATFWSGSVARQVYLFGAIALFLFWRMVTPDAVQGAVDAWLLPEAMPWTGVFCGGTAAMLGWLLYGRERAA